MILSPLGLIFYLWNSIVSHFFLLFPVSPENPDPVDFGAGGRGEAFKSAAPGLTGERSVWDYSQTSSDSELRGAPPLPPDHSTCPWDLQNAAKCRPGAPESPRDAPRTLPRRLCSLSGSSDVILMPSETIFEPFWSQNGLRTETKSSLNYYRPADRVQSLNS